MQAKCRRDKIEPESARPRCREPRRLPLSSPLPMSHKHDNLIRAIFHDPVSGNLQWREIESLLRHLGATIESLSGTRIRVKLNGAEGILHRPQAGVPEIDSVTASRRQSSPFWLSRRFGCIMGRAFLLFMKTTRARIGRRSRDAD